LPARVELSAQLDTDPCGGTRIRYIWCVSSLCAPLLQELSALAVIVAHGQVVELAYANRAPRALNRDAERPDSGVEPHAKRFGCRSVTTKGRIQKGAGTWIARSSHERAQGGQPDRRGEFCHDCAQLFRSLRQPAVKAWIGSKWHVEMTARLCWWIMHAWAIAEKMRSRNRCCSAPVAPWLTVTVSLCEGQNGGASRKLWARSALLWTCATWRRTRDGCWARTVLPVPTPESIAILLSRLRVADPLRLSGRACHAAHAATTGWSQQLSPRLDSGAGRRGSEGQSQRRRGPKASINTRCQSDTTSLLLSIADPPTVSLASPAGGQAAAAHIPDASGRHTQTLSLRWQPSAQWQSPTVNHNLHCTAASTGKGRRKSVSESSSCPDALAVPKLRGVGTRRANTSCTTGIVSVAASCSADALTPAAETAVTAVGPRSMA